MNNFWLMLISAAGTVAVAVVAVVYWRRISRLPMKWFWLGAGLWAVAVAMKVGVALLANRAAIGFMRSHLPYPLLVLGSGIYIGIQSSGCEIGLTALAVLIRRKLGYDANRAIGIGIGAGAFEALLMGLVTFGVVVAYLAGVPGLQAARTEIDRVAAVTSCFWILAPIERIIAILCHTASRALVLLGVAKRKGMMAFWGFVIFALLDGGAGAVHVSGKLGTFSMWWVELAIMPLGILSFLILRWCHGKWRPGAEDLELGPRDGSGIRT